MNTVASMVLPIGLTFGILGFILKKYPPVINTFIGYRTPFAKKNADTWAVANSYSSNLVMWGGIVLTILGLVALALPDIHAEEGTGTLIGTGIILTFAVIWIAATEIHLNKVFDQNGNRRT